MTISQREKMRKLNKKERVERSKRIAKNRAILDKRRKKKLIRDNMRAKRRAKRGIVVGHKGTEFNRLDSGEIPRDRSEICLFVATRNNDLLMPAFFDHYRRIGVDRFFVIDNMSTDGTVDFLIKQKNTHVFQTDEPYRTRRRSNNWNRWANQLLKYTIGNWCVVADSDEFLIYPNYESKSLKDLTAHLEEGGKTAVRAYLIDMYSKYPVKDAIVKRGEDPLKVLQYFDYPLCRVNNPRARISDPKRINLRTTVSLNKYCIFKCNRKSRIKSGHHRVKGCRVSNSVRCGFLHFKFGSDYVNHLEVESERQMYYNRSTYKKTMLSKFSENPNLTFYDEKVSREYVGSKQLVDLGIMMGVNWNGV